MTGSTISCWYSASRNPEERRTFVDMPEASQLLHRDRLHQVACDHSLAILLMAGLDAVIAAVELESRPSSSAPWIGSGPIDGATERWDGVAGRAGPAGRHETLRRQSYFLHHKLLELGITLGLCEYRLAQLA